MKLRDLNINDPPQQLPFIGTEEYELLWISAFWDGPKSGMLSYKDREHWFEMFGENEDDSLGQWYRRYAVVVLTPEELVREHEVHAEFQRYVQAESAELRPRDQWHLFYDKHLEYCRTRHYDGSEVVAWFER